MSDTGVTNLVLDAFRDRLKTALPEGTFDVLEAIEGGAVDGLARDRKGVHCYISYRGERPVERDGAGAHVRRGMTISVIIIKTLHGRSRETKQIRNLNDVMDETLKVIAQPLGADKWYKDIGFIQGVGPQKIDALGSPTPDVSGRDLLFSVLVCP